MATRKKSIKVPVNFDAIANVADNVLTTLGTPTIYIPENSVSTPVTFTSVMVYVAQQSSGSTSQTITTPSITATLSGATANTFTFSGTTGQTGEDISGILGPADFTSYFVSNYGTVTSKTCQIQITFNVSAGATVGAYAYFEITYEYDDTAASQIQTICIPFESLTGNLPTTATTFCTLKQLTGAGGLLSGYATPAIRHRWIEVKGNTGINGNGTDISMSFSFDGGGATILPAKENGGATDNWVYYQVDSSGLTSNATHTFQLWNSPSTVFRWPNVIVNEWVSFEYTSSGTTSCLNYIEIPIEFESPIATASLQDHVFYREILIQEPGNISLVKGAVELQYNTSASMTAQVYAGTQASFRNYIMTASTVGGQYTFNHGIDADSALGSAFTLTRGTNPINVHLYTSTIGNMTNVSGILRLLYSSSIASSGMGSHNSTIYSLINTMSFNTVTDAAITDSFQIPETSYWLTGAGLGYFMFVNATQMSLMVQARLQAGEGAGDGWRELYGDQYTSDAEYSFGGWNVRARDEFKRYPEDPDTNRMNIETSRLFRTTFSTPSRYGARWFVTYHSITSSISGNITNSGGGTVNIDLYQLSGSLPALYEQTTRSGDGSYSFVVYDDTKDYYVSAYVSDTVKGMSKQAVPGTGFDIDLNPATGGGGEFYF